MRFLFLFFIAIPLVEMLLLFEVSDRIGGLSTLGLVVATAVIGVQVLKQQGIATLTRANARLSSGELPATEIVEGMLLAAAGALLLTPGFITDTLGFVLLTGPLRRLIAARLVRSGMVAQAGSSTGGGFRTFTTFSGGTGSGGAGFDPRREGAPNPRGPRERGEIIEGEVVEDKKSLKTDNNEY
ncbi:FxsA family protein [Gammaproteobacteria bacterium]|nr:FxsA family protein [Gammaproteobacteria bacterium]